MVLGISADVPETARYTATQVGVQFPLLSDPEMQVTQQYNMQVTNMPMANMGYIVIDAKGHIRARQIDPQFGENAEDILAIVRDLHSV